VETLSRSWPTGVGSCLLRCHRKLEGCFLVTLAKKVGFQTQQRWNFPLALQMRRMFLWIVIVNPRRRIPKNPFPCIYFPLYYTQLLPAVCCFLQAHIKRSSADCSVSEDSIVCVSDLSSCGQGGYHRLPDYVIITMWVYKIQIITEYKKSLTVVFAGKYFSLRYMSGKPRFWLVGFSDLDTVWWQGCFRYGVS